MSFRGDIARLDDLIDWYEQNNPKAGQKIHVRFTNDQLSKISGTSRNKDGTWSYRNRTLEQIGRTKELPA